MTCEIAVMNKIGIALAADSAVTIGHGDKIYHHAEKLFPLRSAAPVGIMIYGYAEIMAMPWELVINAYSQQLGGASVRPDRGVCSGLSPLRRSVRFAISC